MPAEEIPTVSDEMLRAYGEAVRQCNARHTRWVPHTTGRECRIAGITAVRPMIETEARADERRKIAAGICDMFSTVDNARTFLALHSLTISAGPGAVALAIASHMRGK